MRPSVLLVLLVWSFGCSRPLDSTGPNGTPPPHFLPNLVIIYLDDAGFADTGPTGAGFPTPYLDSLAQAGVVYTSFHVAQAVCTPSRAALLTGTYPNRIGMTGALFPDDPRGLSPDEVTLAEIARSKGYATALFGKWHLGNGDGFLPTQHGFDEFAGIPYSNDMWPEKSPDLPPLPFYEGSVITIPDLTAEDQANLTPLLTDYATDFIARRQSGPFFLYFAPPKPHVPLFVSDAFSGASGLGLYADVMMELDWSVGQILGALERADLVDKTWIIFASDNGPWLAYGNHAGSAGPFREGKFTTFEGGTRVPLLMRFPGYIPAGAIHTETFSNIDILPTFAATIGASLPPHPIDGQNVWDTITRDAPSPQRAYYFWNESILEAVLAGEWKLHFAHDYETVVTPGMDGLRGSTQVDRLPLSLFDLSADPGETTDVSADHPELVRELSSLAAAYEQELISHEREPGHL